MSVVAKYFAECPKEFSPVPIWWWSGEKLQAERLRWQLERLAESGVYNVVILNLAPNGPLYGKDADDPPFFSEAWWDLFEGVCRDAQELGVRLWFYDQLGFSGANIQGEIVRKHPEFMGQTIERLAVDTASATTLTCPAGGRPLAAFALPLNDQGKAEGPPAPLPLEGESVHWPGSTRLHRVMLVYTVDRGFDYYNPDACAALIDAVHGAFERRVGQYFGTVIAGSFQDELPSMPLWGPEFADHFRRLRGYDLLPHLPALWEEYGPESDRVRLDYHTTRADLAEAAFFRPLFEWHEERGLICGFDQQGPARQGHPHMSVECYADYMRTHRWFGAPGSDHHGHGKIHSSIAHLYGRPRTWVEAFHSTGWGGTLEETFDWLIPWLRAGGNLYNPHAVYYSTRGGWWEWAPPSTCWRQPYWKHYRLFARAMTRLCASLAAGVHECDIGVLFPTSTIQAGALRTGLTTWAQEAQEAYRKLTGSMLWYDLRLGLLDQDRRDYDVLDEDSLQRAEIAEGTLRIGEEQYKAVILPNCVVLHAAAAERLLQFIEGGGTVIAVGDTPRWLAGPEGDGLLQRLRQAFRDGRAILVDAPEAVPGALAHLPRPVEAPVPTLRRRIGEATVVLVPATASQASRVRLEGWSYRYDFDVERYAARLRVTVRGVKGAPILWEPFSGEGRPLPYQEREDGVTVDVPFTDGPVALLEWAEEGSGAAAPAAPAAPARLLEELTGPWDVEYVPTIDNRWGDFAWPPGKPVPVQTWRARHLTVDADDEEVPAADDPRWRDVRLTFGPRAWRTEVLPAAELPEPLTTSTDPLTEGADLRWRPVVYSLTRGIDKDRLHYLALGPSGHVPEEFLDFGDVPSGHGVQVRTWLLTDEAIEAYLAVGAGARKEMWLNGRPVGGGGPGYLEIVPIRLVAGANLLEIRLVADEGGPLRGHFAVVRDPKRYVRPEWMQPDDPAVKDSVVRFSRIVEVPFPVTGATVQVGADVPCRLLVNGEVAGQQGGFDPYGRNARIIPYDISAFLKVGENEIAIEASDLGGPLSVLVDGLIEGEDTNILLSSDATWQVTRNGHPVGIRLRRQQWGDPAWQLLYRRPHPLPGASWLEETADEDVVYPLAPSLLAAPRVEWFAIELPPGATEAVFDCHGDVAAYVAGAPVPVGRGAGLEHRIELPEASRAERTLLVRVSGARGYTGGAVFESPVRFRVGTGRMELGDWTRQGLSAYSGGIAYRRVVTLSPGALESGRVVLDLGKVRGTAEVRVNGEMAGVRLLTPYRFDLTPWVKAGENVLEVVVYNTLAPYLDAVSPTYYVFEGQTVSGLFGPVRLLLE